MQDPGVPGFFVFGVFLVIVLGVGSTLFRISTARSVARKAGMDENDATAVALLDQDGLSATYVAGSLHRPAAPTTESRLRDLKRLLDEGLVSQDEYDQRRTEILDAV